MLSPSLPLHLPLYAKAADDKWLRPQESAGDAERNAGTELRRKIEVIAMLIKILLPHSLTHHTPASSQSSLPTQEDDYLSTSSPRASEADLPHFSDPLSEPSVYAVPLISIGDKAAGAFWADCIDPVLIHPVMAAITSSSSHPLPSASSMTLSASPESEMLAPSLRKAGSAGSTASNTASLPTPKSANLPLSPVSGHNTPKARLAALKDGSSPNGASVPLPAPSQGGAIGTGHDTRGLASDLDQLKMQSPSGAGAQALPTIQIEQNGTGSKASPRKPKSINGNGKHHERAWSSSTESSSPSTGPAPPSQLGSVYGAEGFPNYQFDFTQSAESLVDPKLDEDALRAVMSADQAVMKLNGTSSVQSYPGYAPLPTNPYQLPRGYAGFVNPQQRPEPQPISSQHGASRQSSTSSSTTEDASTSSEESDLLPTVEWVNIPKSGMPSTTPFFHVAPGEHRASFGNGMRPNMTNAGRRSPGKMAPPATTGRRRSSQGHGHGPSGVPSGLPPPARESALPGDVHPHAPTEDDDDEATVGHRRERSPSGSSQSAQSGLDLLYAAAYNGQDPRVGGTGDGSSKGKRKAGAGPEAIAQWRTSGIPSGLAGETLASAEKGGAAGGGVPKKRRRSSVDDEDEAIDPALRDREGDRSMDDSDDVYMDEAVDESSSPAPEDADDEEYGTRGRTKGGAGRGGRGGKRGGGAGRGRVSGVSGGLGGGGTPGKAGAPGAGGAGIGGGKKAKKDDDFSPNGRGGGGAGARRVSAGASVVGGVQCEYVNPLPPFNRCTDVFTRKYDLPRHMARHARREGELVEEGKLAEDKALLWKTIKDKPKVECAQCGESFTRMDALKRHQAKQHHG